MGCFLFFKDNAYLILGMCIAIALCMYGIIGIFGFSAFPDEFGYWAPAAAALGYDWSSITGLGPYYSYGYSFLLAPILFLFHDPIIAYRMAIVLNLLLQCASLPVFYLIFRAIFPDQTKTTRSIITAVAVLYPAWSFYTMTTMAEALLYFLFLLLVYSVLKFLERPGIIRGLLTVLLSLYLYLVHMRCIGMIAAVIVTLVIWALSRRTNGNKRYLIGLLILPTIIILFALTFVLKDRIVGLLYHSTTGDMLTWNDYSGLGYRLGKALNVQGLLYLAKDFCGKALYMGIASCGTAYFGTILCFKKAIKAYNRIRDKQGGYLDFLWIYICLAVIFQFGVALFYLNGASAPDATRLDNFLHGRYIDFFLPILIGIGISYMLQTTRPWLGMIVTFVLYGMLGVVALRVIGENLTHMNDPHGFTMIGMGYLLETPLTDTNGFVIKEILFSAGITAVVYSLVLMVRRWGKELILAGIMLIQIPLALQSCDNYIFPYQSYIYGDLMLGEKLEEVMDRYPDKRVLHIYDTNLPYIELVQFVNRDKEIQVLNPVILENPFDIYNYLDEDTILITTADAEYEEDIVNYYKERWGIGHLRMYYTP